MSKKDDTIKVSSESKLQLPLANLIGIIIVVSGAVFGYANLTGRISALETADTLMESDLLKKAQQEPKNLEMYMLIEHLASQIESIEKEIEASRYNKVNKAIIVSISDYHFLIFLFVYLYYLLVLLNDLY